MNRERLGRLGIFSGQLAAFSTPVQRRVVAELEALGYGAIWYGEAFAREPFVQGAIFLSATERMVVATGIASIFGPSAASTRRGAGSGTGPWCGTASMESRYARMVVTARPRAGMG